MVRAQVTAWSERRSQAGASVVIIGVPPPVRVVLGCGELQYSGPRRHRRLCAALLAPILGSIPVARWTTLGSCEGALCLGHGPQPGMVFDPPWKPMHGQVLIGGCGRRYRHVRRADRQVVRRGRHRRVQHREGGPGEIPRRRPAPCSAPSGSPSTPVAMSVTVRVKTALPARVAALVTDQVDLHLPPGVRPVHQRTSAAGGYPHDGRAARKPTLKQVSTDRSKPDPGVGCRHQARPVPHSVRQAENCSPCRRSNVGW